MNNKDIFIIINNKGIDVKKGIKYEDDEFCVILNQQILDLKQEKINMNKVIELYKEKVEFANVISNTFTIILIDKIKRKLSCIQDMSGDTVPIYYYKNNEEIIFSNKLIDIINYSSKMFQINEKTIPYFIKKGFIHNKETLVKDIYKIVPKYNFEMNLVNGKNKFIKKKIKHFKIKEYTTDLYIQEFRKILDINSKEKKIFTTLSNGYDSNFIYSFFDKNTPIEAFSVGGVVGKNETIQVADNMRNHENTNLNVAYVSKDTLNHYPNLIYNLEGALYEKGIFLQYELANTIKSKNVDNAILFTGDGADEIFSAEYHNNIIYLLKISKYILEKNLKFNFGDNLRNLFIKGGILDKTSKYNFLSYIIAKKNGILMNNIGINYMYPYFSRNIINFAYLNRYINFREKKSHKEACKKIIGADILKNIVKTGGATEVVALFENCSYIDKIEELVENSKFNILKIKKNFSSDAYREYLLKILYLEIFEYLFIQHSRDIECEKNIELSELIKRIYND